MLALTSVVTTGSSTGTDAGTNVRLGAFFAGCDGLAGSSNTDIKYSY